MAARWVGRSARRAGRPRRPGGPEGFKGTEVHAVRIICLVGIELWQIIENTLDLSGVLSLKTRRAAETGRAYVPVRDLFQIT